MCFPDKCTVLGTPGTEFQDTHKVDSFQNLLDAREAAQLLASHRDVTLLQFDPATRH